MSEVRERHAEQPGKTHDARVIARFVLIVALVVALVLLAFDNTDSVRIGYVFGHRKAPVWIVLAGAAAAGVIIGWLIKHRPHRRD